MGEFTELYYREPYCKEFDSEVVRCTQGKKHPEMILADTAFYPEGGGQPGDTGILIADGHEARVLDTQKRGDEIVHVVDEAIPAGTQVHGVLNWSRRFSLMQGHTGEHILSGLVHRNFGFDNVGFHMAEDGRIRIDFNGVLDWDQLRAMEKKANELIWADEEVRDWIPSEKELETLDYRSKKELTGKVRLIEIPGGDLCACCGTHVKRTGEIGVIKCLSMAHYKGGVRIEMMCGEPAFTWMQRIVDMNREIAEDFSVKPEEVKQAAEKLHGEVIAEKERAAANLNRYFEVRAEELSCEDGLIIDFEEELAPDDIRRFCDRLIKSGKAPVAAVLSAKADENGRTGVPETYHFVIGAAKKDGKPVVNLREKAKELTSALDGRGGGSPEMIQGSFSAEATKIKETLQTFLQIKN